MGNTKQFVKMPEAGGGKRQSALAQLFAPAGTKGLEGDAHPMRQGVAHVKTPIPHGVAMAAQ